MPPRAARGLRGLVTAIVLICCHTFSLERRYGISRKSVRLFAAGRTSENSNGYEEIQFQVHSSISEIPKEKWDRCLVDDECASPFMEHSWFRCLEESKCASKETGWIPQHLSIIIDGEPWCGFVPLYLKTHSMGEFIFDSTWADAAAANGIDYYPKLLVAVPFTPVTGRKIIMHPKYRSSRSRQTSLRIRRKVASFLKEVALKNNLSSCHLYFVIEEEAGDISGSLGQIRKSGDQSRMKQTFETLINKFRGDDLQGSFLRRTSLQYHWSNSNAMNQGKPYSSFEEYLSCFKSKRRIAIRRERAKVTDDEDIQIDAILGKDILKHDGLVERMFQIYLSTVNKMFWGRQYLTLEFFQMLANSDFLDNLCFMCARKKSSGETLKASDVIAGTFNVVKNGVFYGRYWGSFVDVKNLHFETCYWAAIEYCIKNGLRRMEPGAGGGDYKWARGFDPSIIHSVHFISHPGLRQAVAQYIDYETEANAEVTELLMQKSVVGSGALRGNWRSAA
mmetsp:Transcript_67632/g.195502  ORF Transcript_67632/g.195502 Transcript_67632/m.195502 type:complete len:505 (-) Transcript_67632:235-1749(-)